MFDSREQGQFQDPQDNAAHTEEAPQLPPYMADAKLRGIAAAFERETDPIEGSRLLHQLSQVLKSEWLDPHSLSEFLPLVPRDQLAGVLSAIVARQPEALGEILSVYSTERDKERQIDLFRAIRNAAVNCPDAVDVVALESMLQKGLLAHLHVLEKPLGRGQGFGLLTDFHLMSQVFLHRLGDVRFLPLPQRMPQLRAVTTNGVATIPGDSPPVGLKGGLQFGRSFRYEFEGDPPAEGEERYLCAFKAAKLGAEIGLQHALSRLRFEAEIMEYFQRHQNYFGLESELPLPCRGVANRTHAWVYDGIPHLMYAAHPDYFTYLEDPTHVEQMRDGLLKGVRDLMRLARFGIFHTELAPISHSQNSDRPYRWNIGGLLVGAGRLPHWKEAFQYANLRVSGIADLEHVQRYPSLPAVVPLVNETEALGSLGLQYHLGNSIFQALHIAGLWFARRGAFQSQRAELRNLVEDTFSEAYRAFTGRGWSTLHSDVDTEQICLEMERFMGAKPGEPGYASNDGVHADLGAGVYPAQELIKGVLAFTLRAIPAYVDNKPALLAGIDRSSTAPRDFSDSIPPRTIDPAEFGQFFAPVYRAPAVQLLRAADVSEEDTRAIVRQLRGVDLKVAQNGDDVSTQRIAINARALMRAVRAVLGAERANEVRVFLQLQTDPGLEKPTVTLAAIGAKADTWYY